MRSVMVFGLCACSAYAEPVRIDGWVIDAKGPVANVEVRVVALTPMPCPCAINTDEDGERACHCPKSIAQWKQRLATCTYPAKAMKVLTSDAKGRVALDANVRGGAIEAMTSTAMRWITVPAGADRVGFELRPQVRPKIVVDQNVELRAALLYTDGHCVPFRRDSGNAWSAAGPIPTAPEDGSSDWPVLYGEAKGYEPLVHEWFESDGEPVELALVRKGKKPDSDDELELDHSCHDVFAIDGNGRPLANAVIDVSYKVTNTSFSGGETTTTDRRGKACIADLPAGSELVVHPALDRGGACAGETRIKVTAQMLRRPLRVKVATKTLTRAKLRGRLVTAEKMPVVGAEVTVGGIEPSENKGCSVSTEIRVRSAADGAFEVPLLPIGKLDVEIKHDWYTLRKLDVALPSGGAEIAMDRGGTWRGRVRDADGNEITACDLILSLADSRVLYVDCTPNGFSFTTLARGDATLSLRVYKDKHGTLRTHQRKIKIASAQLTDDVVLPKGETISGRVVNARGEGVRAQLDVRPHDQPMMPNSFPPNLVELTTEANGTFVLRHLEPGRWTINAYGPDKQRATIEVKTGSTGVTIKLR